MTTPLFRLEAAWEAAPGTSGKFHFSLVNLSDETLSGFRLAYTTLTRTADKHACQNAHLVKKVANFHQYAPPENFSLQPGGIWQFSVDGLTRPAKHVTDGAKSAYVTTADNRHLAVAIGDLMLKGAASQTPPRLLPEGKADEPYALLPWPRASALEAGDSIPVALFPAEGAAPSDITAMATVQALYQRLFPVSHVPFSLVAVDGGLPVEFTGNAALAEDAYEISFDANRISLASGGTAGRQYGLTSLAQLLHGARRGESSFRFPKSGRISDSPRYGWRGCHLDVSRQFIPTADVLRFIDLLAWHKLNIFHWHLTDDEAWRLEIRAYPALTDTGARRGPDEPLIPQLGDGAEPRHGFYSQDEVREIVAHAASLSVETVPEVDIPGHCTAVLITYPDMTDGQEAPDSYRSVQGYPNNALNPAIEATYDFLGRVFDEMVELFPSRYVHIGGDEVADGSWLTSPIARKLMEEKGLAGTFELQSFFMNRVKAMLTDRGRKLAGWNEVAHGGGVSPDGTLLMAWQNPDVGIELARDGYDVVMTPGQAYYLDMVQGDEWQEPGASWAGTVPPFHTYSYEAEGEFPEELKSRMRGIQACIWTENFISRDYFNHLVFPRLSAIAEAAWTPKARKDWLRFAAIAPLSPVL